MHQIRFAEFELDLSLFKLERSGQHVKLGPRALDLLVYLISNRDRVVSAETLRHEVWDGTALSESAIATCMSDLRRALGDDATAPRYIETVRGRGYRFIHPIEPPASDDVRARVETDLGRAPLPVVCRQPELEILGRAPGTTRRGAGRDTTRLVLLRRTSGNPFPLVCPIRPLGSLPDRDGTRSPAGIPPPEEEAEAEAEIAMPPLSDLPPETRRALEAASIAGLRFSVQAVAELIQRTQAETLACLTPAVRAQLVCQQESDLVFAHEPLRAALYEGLAPLTRRALHLSMSRHLRGRERPGTRAAEIADHLAAASPLAACDEVIEATIRRSGRSCSSRGEWELEL